MSYVRFRSSLQIQAGVGALQTFSGSHRRIGFLITTVCRVLIFGLSEILHHIKSAISSRLFLILAPTPHRLHNFHFRPISLPQP